MIMRSSYYADYYALYIHADFAEVLALLHISVRILHFLELESLKTHSVERFIDGRNDLPCRSRDELQQ